MSTPLDRKRVSFTVGRLVLIITAIISITASFVTWGAVVKSEVADNTRQIEALTRVVEVHETRIKTGEQEDREKAIQYAEIQKDLQYIKALLEELKDGH